MPKRVRTAVTVLLAALFVFSVGMAVRQQLEYSGNAADYDEARTLAGLADLEELARATPRPAPTPAPPPEPSQTPPEETAAVSPSAPPEAERTPAPTQTPDPYAAALARMDFTALRQVNGDVVGWILIPDTPLSYPLLQGEDNEYYLTHSWKKRRNSGGSIFLECENSRDLSDFNTIIYGHRMRDNSMFATLRRYHDQDFWADHPYVYLSDDTGSHRYEIFAAWEPAVSESVYYLSYRDEEEKQAFLDTCLTRSVIRTGVVPHVWDKVVTLSTCTGNGHETRWVVQAVRWETPPEESAEPEEQETAQEAEETPPESQAAAPLPAAEAAPEPETTPPQQPVALPAQEPETTPSPGGAA